MTAAEVVVDASALVDLLVGTPRCAAVRARLSGTVLHAPAHLDAEVLSAVARLARADVLRVADAEAALESLRRAPVQRHELVDLIDPAWSSRGRIRVVDLLYVALAEKLGFPLLTTDARLARACPLAQEIA